MSLRSIWNSAVEFFNDMAVEIEKTKLESRIAMAQRGKVEIHLPNQEMDFGPSVSYVDGSPEQCQSIIEEASRELAQLNVSHAAPQP